jgi:hypothetical protein
MNCGSCLLTSCHLSCFVQGLVSAQGATAGMPATTAEHPQQGTGKQHVSKNLTLFTMVMNVGACSFRHVLWSGQSARCRIWHMAGMPASDWRHPLLHTQHRIGEQQHQVPCMCTTNREACACCVLTDSRSSLVSTQGADAPGGCCIRCFTSLMTCKQKRL